MNLPIHLDRDRTMLFLIATALVLALALPAAAGTSGEPAGTSEGAGGDLIVGAVALSRSGSIGEPTAQSDCTAQCQDGSTVTCSGSTCSAVDYSCTAEERGYCEGSASGTKYCPELDLDDCPVTCSIDNTCPDGTYLECEGHTGPFACQGGGDSCYVMCDGADGTYLWCPGHFGERYCG